MKLTATLLLTLRTRLSDPDTKQFTQAYLLNELNVAQQEIINELRPEYYDNIATKDTLIAFDENGEYELPDTILGGKTGIKKLFLYRLDVANKTQTKVVARELSVQAVNMILQNGYYEGSATEPRYYVLGGKVKMYAGVAKVQAAATSEGITIIAALSGEKFASGGLLVDTSDYYKDFYLKAPTSGNTYKITAYDNSIARFTIGAPGILVADIAVTEWELLTPYKNNYCGAGLLSSVQQPTDMTLDAGNECELNEAIIPAMLYLTESAVWGSDGKDNRSVVKYNKAMKQVEKLNQKVIPTDGVGPSARKD